MRMNYWKKFNIFCIICAVSYCMAFFAFYFEVKSNFAYYEQIYASMYSSVTDFNAGKDIDSTPVVVERELPIFDRASEAIDYAWNQLQNFEQYEFIVIGTATVNAGPITKNVKVHIIQAHYADGTVLDETNLYDTQDFANKTGSVRRYYKDGYVYIKDGQVLSQQSDGTMLTAHNDNPYKKAFEQDKYYCYIFNKDTIIKELYFKVNYNYSGKIISYSASAYLDTKAAVAGFDKQSQRNGELASTPQFSLVEAHCLIDSKGNVKSLTIKDAYTATYDYSGMSFDYESHMNINITIKNVNSPLSLPEPDVSNAVE